MRGNWDHSCRPFRQSHATPAALGLSVCAIASAVVLIAGCTKATGPQADHVFLESATSAGAASPWTQSVTANVDLSAMTQTLDAPTKSTHVQGDQPGLYGGSNQLSVCDVQKMVNFLQANPAEARAWADVLGSPDVATFAKTLTPVVLTADTRVTNHGFENGVATPFQSVLQTGTAVLADQRGTPRVRCECGNPLNEPEHLQHDAVFTGPKWEKFDADTVIAVQPAPAPQTALNVVRLEQDTSGDIVAHKDVTEPLKTGTNIVGNATTPPTETSGRTSHGNVTTETSDTGAESTTESATTTESEQVSSVTNQPTITEHPKSGEQGGTAAVKTTGSRPQQPINTPITPG